MADGLDRMWAGWRGEYVAGIGEAPVGGCPLCGAIDPTGPQAGWIIHRGELATVILNAFPYNNGHLLVLVNRHVAGLDAVTEEEAAELWRLVRTAHRAILAAYEPDGANIGANLGTAAGAGVPDHLHLHVLPRWAADTSFVTSVAGMRVLPETLDSAAARLRAAWPADTDADTDTDTDADIAAGVPGEAEGP